jgi:hypothetical protein
MLSALPPDAAEYARGAIIAAFASLVLLSYLTKERG